MASPMQSPRRSSRLHKTQSKPLSPKPQKESQGLASNVAAAAVSLDADHDPSPTHTTKATSFVSPANRILMTIISYAVSFSITFAADILAGFAAALAYISAVSIARDNTIGSEISVSRWKAQLPVAWEDFEDAYTGPQQVDSGLFDRVLFGTDFDENTKRSTILCSDKAQDASSITETSDYTLLETPHRFVEEESEPDEYGGSLHDDVEMDDPVEYY